MVLANGGDLFDGDHDLLLLLVPYCENAIIHTEDRTPVRRIRTAIDVDLLPDQFLQNRFHLSSDSLPSGHAGGTVILPDFTQKPNLAEETGHID